MACFFYFTAKLNDFNEDTWIFKTNLTEAKFTEKYFTALYWSFYTLTGIGYGIYKYLIYFKR